jgi:hypothetical protein
MRIRRFRINLVETENRKTKFRQNFFKNFTCGSTEHRSLRPRFDARAAHAADAIETNARVCEKRG